MANNKEDNSARSTFRLHLRSPWPSVSIFIIYAFQLGIATGIFLKLGPVLILATRCRKLPKELIACLNNTKMRFVRQGQPPSVPLLKEGETRALPLLSL